MKIQSSIFIIALMLASIGHAVSRVGGGKIQSLESGFEFSIDSAFKTSQVTEDSVQCLGPVGIIRQETTVSAGTQYFEVSEFRTEFPDATALTKKELIARFEKSNWQAAQSQACELVLRSYSPGIVAYIVTWGSGKGFVIKGTDSADTQRAIQKAFETLKVTSECQWK
jgi:hypothetical protein